MSRTSNLDELEEVLDTAPPSPPRQGSASAAWLARQQTSQMPGWSPRIEAKTTLDAGVADPSHFVLGTAAVDAAADAAAAAASSSSSSASSSSSSAALLATGISGSATLRPPAAAAASASTTTTTPAAAPPSAAASAAPGAAPLSAAELKAQKAAAKKARAAAFAKANPSKVKAGKKKKLSKAERRALQEKQRADKAAKATGGGKNGGGKKGGKGSSSSSSSSSSSKGGSSHKKNAAGDPGASASASSSSSGRSASNAAAAAARSNVNALFSHLPPYVRTPAPARPRRFAERGDVHPAIARVGLKFSQGTIVGGNARCVALLQACKASIVDYETPPSRDFCRVYLETLNQLISYVVRCRPMSVSMGNAIRFLKRLISSRAARALGSEDVKEYLCERIDEFIDKRIKMADELIMRNLLGLEPHTKAKIVDGDVVLTYGRSHVVEEALKFAHTIGTRFRVIVVDSRPRMEGRALLKSLTEHGIQCTYVLIVAASYVMKEATKVILGAAAMMANGTALSRVGTATVAMMAHTHRRPVIFCCETYKFSERVQMDAVVSNEVADPDDLVAGHEAALGGWKEARHLGVLNLSYDVTPQEFITVIVTDVGNIPTTSVPVIIREFLAEGRLDADAY